MVAVAGAIGQALELVAAPAGLQQARSRDFPDDTTMLLRLVAGDAATLEQAVIESNETEEAIREAAEFFVLQVCFTPGVDSYRVLGANRNEAISRIREHYRLLVRWLHPDRNSDAWQTVYLDRVNKAWRDLRDPEARAEYDRLGPEHDEGEATDPVNKMPIGVAAASELVSGRGKRVSARTMRQLPTVVMAGLGAIAAVVLALMYADYQAGTQARQALSTVSPRPARQPDEGAPISAQSGAQMEALTPEFQTGQAESGEAQIEAESSFEPTLALPRSALASAPDHGPAEPAEDVAKPVIKPIAAPVSAPVIATAVAVPRAEPLAGSSSVTSDSDPATPADSAEDTPPASAIAESAQGVSESASAPAVNAGAVAKGAESMASTAVSNARMDPMPGDTVDRLLEQFRRAYDEGNLIGLMALFTRDARNIAKDSKLLADDYRELFATSSARALSLSDMSWWREGEQVVVIARFNAAITPIGRPRARRIGGDIRFELRREDGEVRIARIRHQVQ